MSIQNQFIVTGNIGATPELHKKSEASSGVVSFNLAQNGTRFNEATKKHEKSHTNWFPVKAFGNLGTRVKATLKKGDRVTVYGKCRTYQFETADGSKGSGFEVLADDIYLSGILPKVTEDAPDFEDFENESQ